MPLSYLDHMVRFFPSAVGKAKAIEDLEASTLETVGLTAEDLRVALLDNTSLDTAAGHPSCHHHAIGLFSTVSSHDGRGTEVPGWTSADNETVSREAVSCRLPLEYCRGGILAYTSIFDSGISLTAIVTSVN